MYIELPKNVEDIINNLEDRGYETYAVGGCIRDSLLNKTPNDWDITTSATPEEMKNALDLKSADTGLKHGTITFITGKEQYEVTTFRKDGEYSDGRRPDSVEFTNSVKEDLSRRDFTINSMAYSHKRGLIDPFNGEKDLRDKKLKAVGDPNKRFKEDGLRVMRGIRFASSYGFSIEYNTSKAIHNNLDCLENISKERIKTELFKMLSSKDGSHVASLLKEYKDVMFKVIPQLEVIDNFNQNNKYHDKDLLDHTLAVVANTKNDPKVRFAALMHDVGKPSTAKLGEDGYLHFKHHPKISKNIAEEVCKDLKMSNEEINDILFMVEQHDNRPSPTVKSVRRFIVRCGDKNVADNLLNLQMSDALAHTPETMKTAFDGFEKAVDMYKEEIQKQNEFLIKDLKINGKDLLDLGYHQGREIGKRLNELFNMVVDGDIENNREYLLKNSSKDLIFVKEHKRKGRIVKAHFRKRSNM